MHYNASLHQKNWRERVRAAGGTFINWTVPAPIKEQLESYKNFLMKDLILHISDARKEIVNLRSQMIASGIDVSRFQTSENELNICRANATIKEMRTLLKSDSDKGEYKRIASVLQKHGIETETDKKISVEQLKEICSANGIDPTTGRRVAPPVETVQVNTASTNKINMPVDNVSSGDLDKKQKFRIKKIQ